MMHMLYCYQYGELVEFQDVNATCKLTEATSGGADTAINPYTCLKDLSMPAYCIAAYIMQLTRPQLLSKYMQ